MAEVVVRSLQGLTQSLEVGEHRLLSDEPVDASCPEIEGGCSRS